MIHFDAIYPTCLSNIHSVFRDSSRFCFTMVTLCLGRGFNKNRNIYKFTKKKKNIIIIIANLAFDQAFISTFFFKSEPFPYASHCSEFAQNYFFVSLIQRLFPLGLKHTLNYTLQEKNSQ